MKFRVTDQLTAAREFSAGSAAEFRSRLAAAWSEMAQAAPERALYLHVATDNGEWISPNYPRSNAPFALPSGFVGNPQQVLDTVARANRAGTWFEHELRALSSWVTNEDKQ